MAYPPQLTSRLLEGIAHHEAGRLDRAEAIYRQVAKQCPRLPVVFDLWGRLAEQQGRLDEALGYFRRALTLEPRSAEHAVRCASLLIASHRAAEAEAMLRKLTAAQPRSAELWNALGFALQVLNRLAEAARCHERAVACNPKLAAAWLQWAIALSFQGRAPEALERYDRALALEPGNVEAAFGRARILYRLYRTDESLAAVELVLRRDPHHLDARSHRLFVRQGLETTTREELAAEHRAYGRCVGPAPDLPPGHDYTPERRLRVAVLSPDFRTHSCAYFIEPLLRGLDRERFELYLYHDHVVEDEVTARFRTLAAVWRNFVGEPDPVVARTVRADRPDILIELSGHVAGARLPLLAKRLAPVQVTYLGYPDTTGVPAIDYRFTDAIADPPGDSEAWATEKLVRFSSVAWCYQPPAFAPLVVSPPIAFTKGATPAAGSDRRVTFGCFSTPTKYTPRLLGAWARILASVPGARLVLKGTDFEQPAVRATILAQLGDAGLPLDSVELLPRAETGRAHLEQYARMDIALDTFPYTGTTTICEALWMGRPVVALHGDRHAARVAGSLLRAVGHPEWVAGSIDEYVAIAVRLASQPEVLAGFAANGRDELARSPLLDHAGQSRRFGDALRACWREKCAAVGAGAQASPVGPDPRVGVPA